MIICKCKDGSSIRVYKKCQDLMRALLVLSRMGFRCDLLAVCLNHFSLKVMVYDSPTHKEWLSQNNHDYNSFLSGGKAFYSLKTELKRRYHEVK